MPAFDVNNGFLYALVALALLVVVAQSVYFLMRSWREAAVRGMDMARLRRVALSCAVFTIMPAVSILLGVLSLSRFLGLPLPWLRLSVIGALTYELPAATTAANALGLSTSQAVTDPRAYSAIAFVMTWGIMIGPVLVPLLSRRIQNGLVTLRRRDEAWSRAFMSALFLGMISAFLGVVFARTREGLPGFVPVFVLMFSALIMAAFGLARKQLAARWLENYALPISMLGGMAFAVFLGALIG